MMLDPKESKFMAKNKVFYISILFQYKEERPRQAQGWLIVLFLSFVSTLPLLK